MPGKSVTALVLAVAVVAAGSVLARAQDEPRRATREDRVLETLTVSNRNPNPVRSTTALDPAHAYRITVSGTVSDWCPATATKAADCSYGAPFEVGKGVDALFCYAKWRCPTPELWRQLRIQDQGLDEFSGQSGNIRYSPTHRYAVVVHDYHAAPGLRLVAADAVGSWSDNSGAFKVEIVDLGLNAAQPAPKPKPLSGPKLHDVKGLVKVRSRGGALTQISEGTVIKAGDEIHTYWDGETMVSTPAGGLMRIPPMTVVVVSDSGNTVDIKVGGPVLFYGKFEIKSSSVVTADMGTRFSFSHDAATQASVVSVTSGWVRVQPTNPDLAPVTLKPGQEVMVSRTAESPVAAIGHAGAPAGAIARSQALALVTRVIGRNMTSCRLTVGSRSIVPSTRGWRVSVRVTGGTTGLAAWDVTGSRVTAANALARAIEGGCATGATPAGPLVATPAAAIDLVKAILQSNATACESSWTKITAAGRPGSWRVTAAVVVQGAAGTAIWTITGRTPTPANALATRIQGGCTI